MDNFMKYLTIIVAFVAMMIVVGVTGGIWMAGQAVKENVELVKDAADAVSTTTVVVKDNIGEVVKRTDEAVSNSNLFKRFAGDNEGDTE